VAAGEIWGARSRVERWNASEVVMVPDKHLITGV
jgi:hypothetical protein